MSTVTLSAPSIPSITIFVRHSTDCKYAGDETCRVCRCPKHFRYTVDGKQVRQSARTRFWKTAEDRRHQLETSFAANVEKVEIQPDTKKTIERYTELFIQDKRSQGVSESTLTKYKLELERFEKFMAGKSKLLPHEIALSDLTEFRSEWAKLYPSTQTQSKVQERLRAFLKYCYQDRAIDRVPKLSPISVDVTPTLPLEAEQYSALLETVPKVFTGERAIRVRGLIQFMRHTGLAIRDAVTIERREMEKKGNLWRVITAREKTGTHVYVPLRPDVAKEVLAAASLNKNKQFMFWNTGTGKPQSAVTNWQHDLREVFRKAGMPNGHPHQLRDTFAVGLLEKGVPLEEVSKLLGHRSIRVTEKHYAKWVKTRQTRLDELVTATWKD